MSNFLTAQGSLRITRLRNGDSIIASLYTDKPLFQGVVDNTTITPDWSQPSEQPTVSPEIYLSSGKAARIVDFQWRYNGSLLEFGAISTDGWAEGGIGYKTNPTVQPRFRACFAANNADDRVGALRIVSNLASPTNTANDSLEFTANVESDGVNHRVGTSIDVLIQQMGASAYVGLITVSPSNTFAAQITDVTLTPSLLMGGSSLSAFSVRWYKDTDLIANAPKVLTVNRDDVSGSQVYIAEFLVGGNVVSRYGVCLTDVTDEFHVAFVVTDASGNAAAPEIRSTNDSITVRAKVVDRDGNDFTLPASATWETRLMNHDTWQVIRSVASDTITVTSADTDRNGMVNDVEINAEVSA